MDLEEKQNNEKSGIPEENFPILTNSTLIFKRYDPVTKLTTQFMAITQFLTIKNSKSARRMGTFASEILVAGALSLSLARCTLYSSSAYAFSSRFSWSSWCFYVNYR